MHHSAFKEGDGEKRQEGGKKGRRRSGWEGGVNGGNFLFLFYRNECRNQLFTRLDFSTPSPSLWRRQGIYQLLEHGKMCYSLPRDLARKLECFKTNQETWQNEADSTIASIVEATRSPFLFRTFSNQFRLTQWLLSPNSHGNHCQYNSIGN